jgi:HSP20 family protein
MAQLMRYNDPFSGLTSLHSQLDTMFNDIFGSGFPTPGQTSPAMDIYTEDDKQLVAEVSVPGFSRDDIEINVHDGLLEIKGHKQDKEEQNDKKRSYMMRQSHRSFYRSIALPKQADEDNVRADFSDGLLKIEVPFKELPAPKKVAIGSGTKK